MLFCLTADYIFATGVGTYSFCLWRYQASDRRDFREAGPWAAAGERQDEASFRSKWGARADLAVEPARATGGRLGEPGYRKTVEAKELTTPQTPAQSASDRSNVTIKIGPAFG